MSVAQPNQADSRPSLGLTLNLSSNNPFRNRAASPISAGVSPGSYSPREPPPRPVSRNPFLEPSNTQTSLASPDKMSFSPDATAPPRPVLSGNAADLFDNLTLNERPANNSTIRPPPPRSNTDDKLPPPYSSISGRSENLPPRGPPGHRPSRSQEEAIRARRAATGSSSRARPSGELDIFADPIESCPKKSDQRRGRRNSESSVQEKSGKLLDPEEEKKRQERKRRERKYREHKDGRSKKPDRKLDIIDQLDATSIYGTGLFHHDGPFDACNPHRNRQGSRRAPMQAFPKDSLNNVLGGGGPINKRPDHAAFLGNNNEEAFKDYSKGGVGYTGYEPYNDTRPKVFRQDSATVQSATTRVEPIHGEETLGLGTSTFLEGAPASRTAMQRRASEQSPVELGGGLSRKKSLAQKIRGINNGRRENGPGRVTSPGVSSPDGALVSPNTPIYTPGGTKNETNPFFNEYGKGDDTKKETITILEPEKPGRPRAPSSPRRGFGASLERRVTSDGSSGAEQPAKSNGGGFLSRVKSLKGGPRKQRAAPPPPNQVADS